MSNYNCKRNDECWFHLQNADLKATTAAVDIANLCLDVINQKWDVLLQWLYWKGQR